MTRNTHRNPGLTKRELRIARLFVEPNQTTVTVAAQLHLSRGTVRTHLHNSYRKLDIHRKILLLTYLMNLDAKEETP